MGFKRNLDIGKTAMGKNVVQEETGEDRRQ